MRAPCGRVRTLCVTCPWRWYRPGQLMVLGGVVNVPTKSEGERAVCVWHREGSRVGSGGAGRCHRAMERVRSGRSGRGARRALRASSAATDESSDPDPFLGDVEKEV